MIFLSLLVAGGCSTSAAAGDERHGNASSDKFADVVPQVTTALDAAPVLSGLLFPALLQK